MTRRLSRPRKNATGVKFWKQRGFIDAEASAFKDITTDAISDSPYIKKMISNRIQRYLRAGRDGLTNRKYYFRIRQLYVKQGLADNTNILHKNSMGESQAFKLFNFYKESYGPTDSSGKPIGTPRPKTKAVSKKGSSKDRLTNSIKSEIDRLRGRLQFPMSDFDRRSLQTQLANQERKLKEIETQFD